MPITDRNLTISRLDTVVCIPQIIAPRPGQLIGDGGKHVEQGIGNENVVVGVHQQEDQHDGVTNAWKHTAEMSISTR